MKAPYYETASRIDSLAKRVAELEDEVAKLTVVIIGALSTLSIPNEADSRARNHMRALMDIIAPEVEGN